MTGQEVERFRQEFPVVNNCIFLNNAGVCPLSRRVQTAMSEYLQEATELGPLAAQGWYARVEETRRDLASLVKAKPEEIGFVKNTSHGLGIFAAGLDWRAGDNVATVQGEFPANVYPWLNLRRLGVETRAVERNHGRILLEDLAAAMDRRTRAVAISWVQFTNGFRANLPRLAELCREKQVLLVVDGVQGVGALDIDVTAWGVDFLSADGHKWLLAPEGQGFIYCSSRLLEQLQPAIVGWGSVQNPYDFEKIDFRLAETARRFEEGTWNVVGILGLGAAVKMLLEAGVPRIEERVLGLAWHLADLLKGKGYEILSPLGEGERSGILTFRSEKRASPGLAETLRQGKVVCALRGGGVRFSPHYYNTEEEIAQAVSLLPPGA